jgi:hypothetical protein
MHDSKTARAQARRRAQAETLEIRPDAYPIAVDEFGASFDRDGRECVVGMNSSPETRASLENHDAQSDVGQRSRRSQTGDARAHDDRIDVGRHAATGRRRMRKQGREARPSDSGARCSTKAVSMPGTIAG